jgi:alpha-galactosidase
MKPIRCSGQLFPGCALVALLVAACSALAVVPNPEEQAEVRRWVAAKFQGITEQPVFRTGLTVLANHGEVTKKTRGGQPLNPGGQKCARGLYCHANSRIVVHLPAPGGIFNAVAGLDNNEDTRRGKGSVIFSVQVGGQEAFKSPILRVDSPPKQVAVELGGASEFVIEIGDAGDGIGWDQSDWGDARVTLADGRVVWLDDFPIYEGAAEAESGDPIFSFTYGGKPMAGLLSGWPLERNSRALDAQRREHTLTWTDPQTRLVVRCVAIEYLDFPTVEWTVYFRNGGGQDTPILEKIMAADLALTRSARGEFLLHHQVGSPADGNDYRPLETVLKPGSTKRIGAFKGRPTNSDWSYFNLEKGGGEGLIMVVGWPGQWASDFVRDAGRGLRILAGQELTHFKLLPGEEIRTPLMVLQFWKGDWIRAQNIWRRWMLTHSMPKPGGKLPPPQFVASSSRQYDEMIKANETNQILFIDRYLAEGLKLDYWWMDAGWYEHHGGGWPKVGTWLVDSNRFPNGLRAVSDHARKNGMKVVVWFEPERVSADTWLAKNHPEWVLGGGKGGLLNLGNEEARKWLTDHVDRLIREQGIGLYRQDFNMDPLEYWRRNDAPDRQGITEIRHVTGFLAYWDELLRRHPGLLIDSCASGGRRNDLETMRRSVPLWRSDYAYETTGHQCMTYGISLWLPYHGTGTVAARNASYYGSGRTPVEPYAFWSNVTPSLGFGIDMRVPDLDYPALRQLVDQWRQVILNYFGDFYPITSWTRDNSLWMAWQFDRPEQGMGLVQVFRREDSPYESARFRLRNLDPEATYEISCFGLHPSRRLSGRELIEQGLPVTLSERPQAAVILYRRTAR